MALWGVLRCPPRLPAATRLPRARPASQEPRPPPAPPPRIPPRHRATRDTPCLLASPPAPPGGPSTVARGHRRPGPLASAASGPHWTGSLGLIGPDSLNTGLCPRGLLALVPAGEAPICAVCWSSSALGLGQESNSSGAPSPEGRGNEKLINGRNQSWPRRRGPVPIANQTPIPAGL